MIGQGRRRRRSEPGPLVRFERDSRACFYDNSRTESNLTNSMTDPQRNNFDLIVIGAGINGAGVARDAAMRGLKVCVLDKADIASGTSSASTRLIHGGLRYLEHGEFGLVRESLRERETLLKIAPHLVKPIPILIPIYKAARRSRLQIRAGMRSEERRVGKECR